MDSHIWALLTSRQCTVWYSILRWPSRPLVSNFTNEVNSNSLKCSFFLKSFEENTRTESKIMKFWKILTTQEHHMQFYIMVCSVQLCLSPWPLSRYICRGWSEVMFCFYHNPQAPGVINFYCNTKKYISYLNNTYYIGRGYIFLQEKLIT